ncbi:MAG: DUF2860 family protein [Pseudomonadales bacterium]|nr:DUF2860 family protein [Pseudomonadales bacterium]
MQTTNIDTLVWVFLTDAKRNDTDRPPQASACTGSSSQAADWECASASEIDIDKDAAASLALSKAQRHLLDRNGDVDHFDLFYEFASADKAPRGHPGLSYVDQDLDGNAMASDSGIAS